MTTDLATRHVAAVVRTLPPGHGVVHGQNYRVQQSIRKAVKRGALEVCSPFYDVPGVPGEVYAVVRHHPERSMAPAPAWRKPAILGASVLAVTVTLGWLLSMAGPAVGFLLALAFALLAAAKLRARKPFEVTGTFRATVRRK